MRGMYQFVDIPSPQQHNTTTIATAKSHQCTCSTGTFFFVWNPNGHPNHHRDFHSQKQTLTLSNGSLDSLWKIGLSNICALEASRGNHHRYQNHSVLLCHLMGVLGIITMFSGTYMFGSYHNGGTNQPINQRSNSPQNPRYFRLFSKLLTWTDKGRRLYCNCKHNMIAHWRLSKKRERESHKFTSNIRPSISPLQLEGLNVVVVVVISSWNRRTTVSSCAAVLSLVWVDW